MTQPTWFPTLSGSEKQVAWANQLRLEIYQLTERFAAEEVLEEKQDLYRSAVKYVISRYKALKEARFWIDARFNKEHALDDSLRKFLARAETEYFCPDCETFSAGCVGGCNS